MKKKDKVGKVKFKKFANSLKKFSKDKVDKYITKLNPDTCDEETLLREYTALLLDK